MTTIKTRRVRMMDCPTCNNPMQVGRRDKEGLQISLCCKCFMSHAPQPTTKTWLEQPKETQK